MKRLVLFAAVLVAVGLAYPGRAQEVCVQCDGPGATYRCSVSEIERAGAFRGRGKVVEYACITELARQGRHERCRVSRDLGSGCLGDPRTITWTGAGVGVGEAAGEISEPAVVDRTNPERAKSEPPRTLVEAARQTAEQTKSTAQAAGEKIERAGEAVGGAVKKTWTCLVTLFAGC